MVLEEQLREYIKLCEAGSTCEAMERFYADDVVVFENHELARAGRTACIEHERAAVAQAKEPAKLRAKGHAAHNQSGVAFIEWVIRFLGEDERPMRLDEVAVQRWARGRIVEERFYYEGMVDEGDEEPESAASQP